MNKSESITKLAVALCKIQGEIESVAHDSSNPFYKSKYASLGAVIAKTKPVMQKYGVSIHQIPASSQLGSGITTIVMHESGEFIADTISIAIPETSKKPGEDAGKIITYLRRYAWASALGLYTGDDDDLHSAYHGEKSENTQQKKSTETYKRPFSPEKLKETLTSGVNSKGEKAIANEGQRGFLVGEMSKIFKDNVDRYEVNEYLFGVRSSKKLTGAQVLTALNHVTQDGFREVASQELISVLHQSQKDKGQKELIK